MPIVSAWRARQLPMSQTKNGVDCLVLRAISDNCDEAYDAICEREFDLFSTRVSQVTSRSISSAALPLRNSASI